MAQESSTGEIGVHSLTFDENDSSMTDNGQKSIDHGYSNTAVARQAVDQNSLTFFMCSHEIGGAGYTYYDAIPTASPGPSVTLSDSTYT